MEEQKLMELVGKTLESLNKLADTVMVMQERFEDERAAIWGVISKMAVEIERLKTPFDVN